MLVDYGGGSGLLSFLAYQLGIGTIVYNDIYDVSCDDVRELTKFLDIRIDHIVHGDVGDLVNYLQSNSIHANSISSFDVIEHIYDLEKHFHTLGHYINQPFRVVYASGANIKNPIYVHKIKKHHRKCEYTERNRVFGYKERDSLHSYYEIRREIIQSYASDLEGKDIDMLARATRGLIEEDIEKAVDEYRSVGRITYENPHSTNTCDPLTGNWSEHLINLKWLHRIVEDAGFSVMIFAGRYYVDRTIVKKVIKTILNFFIRISGRNALIFAQYYILLADYNPKKANQLNES